VRAFSVVSVPVSDQERSKRFYLEVLGFELIADATFGDDLRWLQVGPPGAETTLALVTWFDDCRLAACEASFSTPTTSRPTTAACSPAEPR
jgi:catechol 2,3-dioxygenase-like lactoylglutathione lyase family enzyme